MRICRRTVLLGASVSLGLGAAAFVACGGAIETPIPSVHRSLSPDAPADTLVVFLPGFSDDSRDYLANGFEAEMRAAGIDADARFLDAHFGYYRRGIVGPRVLEEVIEPARARGQKIWIVGISMGGVGALLSARDAEGVEGLVLLSPFLGRPKLTRALREAGGVDAWEPPPPEAHWDIELWRWIKHGFDRSTPIYVGWGAQESDAIPNFELVAELAGPERTFVVEGGHKWTTWKTLWPQILEAGALRPATD